MMTAFQASVEERRARLRSVGALDLQKRLYAHLLEHVQREINACAGAVRQLEEKQLKAVVGSYGENDAWRWCATDDLQALADIANELARRAEGATGVLLEASPTAQPDLPMELDPPVPARGEPL